MEEQSLLQRLRDASPPSLRLLRGDFLEFDESNRCIRMCYELGDEFCHSGNVVQGGFITSMVDAAMAYAVIASAPQPVRVPTLEIKVSFIAPGKPGRFIAEGRIIHAGKSTGFLAATLYQNDKLISTSSSTVKIVPI